MASVRTRFAPSPTGFLHVGGARTALFNWLFARRHGGEFVVRIEDTDTARSTDASTQNILDSMAWLGLDSDVPITYQSERLSIYQEHLQRLWDDDKIYPAFETKEVLDAAREAALSAKENPVYDRAARALSREEAQAKMDAGEEFVWRLKVDDAALIRIPEKLMGGDNTHITGHSIGDFIITRRGTQNEPGWPLYNFVCTVDDALMGITHVIRGVEHLQNAAKQILIYNALGFNVPEFVHLPLIMKNGKKMSKRDDDADENFPVSVDARRALGYTREGTLNFLALLGWTPANEEELLAIDAIIDGFDLDRLSKSNANFDEDKYLHVNAWHIAHMDNATLSQHIAPFMADAGLDLSALDSAAQDMALTLTKERTRLLRDFPKELTFALRAPETFDAKGVEKFFNTDISCDVLTHACDALRDLSPWGVETIDPALHSTVEAMGLKFGQFGPVIRLALSGTTQAPGIGQIMAVIGQEETLKRLTHARDLIQAGRVPTAA